MTNWLNYTLSDNNRACWWCRCRLILMTIRMAAGALPLYRYNTVHAANRLHLITKRTARNIYIYMKYAYYCRYRTGRRTVRGGRNRLRRVDDGSPAIADSGSSVGTLFSVLSLSDCVMLSIWGGQLSNEVTLFSAAEWLFSSFAIPSSSDGTGTLTMVSFGWSGSQDLGGLSVAQYLILWMCEMNGFERFVFWIK